MNKAEQDRYMNDPVFNRLVGALVSLLNNIEPSDLIEAVPVAIDIYVENLKHDR